MKWWVYAIILILVGLGVWKHYITFDPLNLVVLALLIWTQFNATSQRQQLADLIVQNHKTSLAAQKALLDKLTEVRAEVRRSKT